MITLTSFAKGQLAFAAGKNKNPYIQYTRDWRRWNTGYLAAAGKALKAQQSADLEAIESRPLPQWVTEEATK